MKTANIEQDLHPPSEADVEAYHEDGYICFEQFFSPEEISALRAAIDEAVASGRDRILGAEGGGRRPEAYERVFNQMVNLWTDNPAAKEIAFHPRLAACACRLSKAQHVRLFQDHAMVKAPGPTGRPTIWHQDAPFWPMEPVGALSAWIAVDDVTEANGCMHFVPGTHRLGILEGLSLQNETGILEQCQAEGATFADPVPVPMTAGSLTFHHGCTFHSAGPNQTDQPRRAFAVIYIPDYTRYTGGTVPSGVEDELTVGEPFDHALHPIVSHPSR